MLANIRAANAFIDAQENPALKGNLGIASATEIPWTGGGSFIIWDHVRSDPRQEAGSMPARMDALHETYADGNPAREAVMLAATKGRGYFNIPIWRRIEQLLSAEIGAIMHEVAENPAADSADVLRAHLDPLAGRVTAALGN